MNIFEQGLLKYLTKDQLDNIQKYKIGIAGCGGLGSNIANILVRSGVKNLEIIDDDIVDASNLNRQNYFIDEISLSKVEITAKRLKQINPDINIRFFKTKITSENIGNFFKDSDIVFEAFDKAKDKQMIFEYFYEKEKRKIIIMGNGMAGIENKAMQIRKLNNHIYIVGDGITNISEQNPPFAPRVILCASMMASVAFEIMMNG